MTIKERKKELNGKINMAVNVTVAFLLGMLIMYNAIINRMEVSGVPGDYTVTFCGGNYKYK